MDLISFTVGALVGTGITSLVFAAVTAVDAWLEHRRTR